MSPRSMSIGSGSSVAANEKTASPASTAWSPKPLSRRPYRHARRVFWIVDNGTAHRGPAAVRRLQTRFPNLVLVHGPVHASWLNQIEIYFSVLQRKVLTPNDFASLSALAQTILDFQRHYQGIARPFDWRFTRKDLAALLRKLDHSLAAA